MESGLPSGLELRLERIIWQPSRHVAESQRYKLAENKAVRQF